MNNIIKSYQSNNKQCILDEHLTQLMKELTINEKKEVGQQNLSQSRISLKSIPHQIVNETMIAKLDSLEKELIKKRYELQIIRKDLYNILEKEDKEVLIGEL